MHQCNLFFFFLQFHYYLPYGKGQGFSLIYIENVKSLQMDRQTIYNRQSENSTQVCELKKQHNFFQST